MHTEEEMIKLKSREFSCYLPPHWIWLLGRPWDDSVTVRIDEETGAYVKEEWDTTTGNENSGH